MKAKSADEWLLAARAFYSAEDWAAALAAARNALRLNPRHLPAWHLGSDILIKQDRHYDAGRYAKTLKRFAQKLNEIEEVSFADRRLAEVEEYFATLHRRMGETDLTHFAAIGDLQKVRELLADGADPNEPNRIGWTPLHCVGQRGIAEMARLLVERGANLEATDSLKETPLIKACCYGNKPLITVLLELGANVNHVAKEKHTALWYAIGSMKDLATVRLLIESGADPNETYEYGDNPFLHAVGAQKREVVDYLLPLTKDPGRMNKHQVCAMSFSAHYNDTDLIAKLLARGVDAEQATDYGHTPLMSAAESNAVEAARILLAHGANPYRKTKYGESAISIAERGEHAEIHALLTGGKELDRRRD